MVNMKALNKLLLILPLLFEISACSEPGIEQKALLADSGRGYFHVLISYHQASFGEPSPDTPLALDLPFAAISDQHSLPLTFLSVNRNKVTFRPQGEKGIAFPTLVKDGQPLIDQSPYVEFRTALIINEQADAELIFSQKGSSLRQFAEDLASLGVENAVLIPRCNDDGRYFYGGATLDLPMAAEDDQCIGRLVLQ